MSGCVHFAQVSIILRAGHLLACFYQIPVLFASQRVLLLHSLFLFVLVGLSCVVCGVCVCGCDGKRDQLMNEFEGTC